MADGVYGGSPARSWKSRLTDSDSEADSSSTGRAGGTFNAVSGWLKFRDQDKGTGNSLKYVDHNPNPDVASENLLPPFHDYPLPSDDKSFKLKNYTLKSQFTKTTEVRNDDASRQYIPLLENMKQKTSLTYQHLCGSNRNRLTKKSSAYHQLHLLSKSKQNTEQDLDNFVRLYGTNYHADDVTKEKENVANDAFRFSPRIENTVDFTSFNIADIGTAVDGGEPEMFASEYFSPPFKHAEQGVRRSMARQLVETGYIRNVPSVNDLLDRECNASEAVEQNAQFREAALHYYEYNYDVNENNWQGDVDNRIRIGSFRNALPFGEICGPENARSYPMSDTPSPSFSAMSETSEDGVNYEYTLENTRKLPREHIPKEKVLFPFVSFPKNDGAIVIQEMLPTY